MSDVQPPADPAPIDDGWQPEPDHTLSTRVGGGPVQYFRDVPARFFAWLGGIVFVAGWVVAAYIAFSYGVGVSGGDETAYRLQLLLTHGLQATTAAAILWGVAAFLWVRVLPGSAEDAPDPA